MFDRLPQSFALARSSWQVLRLDKHLLVFPILSGIGCVLVLASFLAPLVVNPHLLDFLQADGDEVRVPLWFYAVLFAYYFCNYFVVIFFNSALVGCALLRFNGDSPKVRDGLSIAAARLPQILAWALVSATVGLLLKAVENVHEKAGQLISAVLGTAWTVLTYFVVPVLVVEKVNPIQAVARSMNILSKTWGEALVGKIGLGFVLFLLALPAVAVAVVGMMALTASPVLGIALLALAGAYFLVYLAVGPALNGIFLAALYQYAVVGQVPSGFDRSVLEHAFEPKRAG
ncbi:MAG TPA: DUF6159 family protein [Gemmataceae bacterium]|nr:DUF6159 family protein [Gemmataceae bacterium]